MKRVNLSTTKKFYNIWIGFSIAECKKATYDKDKRSSYGNILVSQSKMMKNSNCKFGPITLGQIGSP
jgi:hypothetical protein